MGGFKLSCIGSSGTNDIMYCAAQKSTCTRQQVSRKERGFYHSSQSSPIRPNKTLTG